MAGLSSGMRFGAYEVLGPLGAGGMGEVYRARDTALNREVALKILPPALAADPDRRLRFEREALAAASLNHPNIVTIHSIEEAGGVRFLTMELVEGTLLSEMIGANGLPTDMLLRLAIPLVDAVSAAHQKGIVHRDLKPANVMVTADRRVKVLDFGLAKLREPVLDAPDATTARTAALTGEGRILGTVAYMSPEQAEGREIDHRSDIFSLGVMLYEMASGRRPFQGSSSIATISAILRDTPPPLTDIRHDLPADFARIVRRSLAKDQDRRYQTAVDLRNELEELKDDTTVSRVATAPALPRRRSLPIAAAAAAVIVMLGAGVAVWGGWFAGGSESGPSRSDAPLNERQLTTNPLENPIFATAISPDGKYAAYADITSIHIRLIDTGETRTLPVPDGFCFICASLAWSPDGTRILAAGPAGPAQREGVWMISTLTGEIRPLIENARDVAMSPDGSRIVFLRGTSDIWTMTAAGADAKVLVAGGPDLRRGMLTWSPDGQRVGYLAQIGRGPQSTIELRHLSTGEVRTVGTPARLEELVWTRDSVLYVEHIDFDTHDLWELKIDAATATAVGEPVRVTRWNGFQPSSLDAAPDGRRLVLTRSVIQSDVHLAALNRGALSADRRLTVDTRSDLPASWNGPGDLFFVSPRNGTDDVWKQTLTSEGAALVVGGDDLARSPDVSPDGRWLVYLHSPAPVPGSPPPLIQVMRVPLAGGAAESVFQLTGRWSILSTFGWNSQVPDLRCPTAPTGRCVVAEDEKGSLVLSAFDPAQGGRERVARIDGPSREISWDLSPDGTRIVYARWAWNTGEKVSVITLADGRVRDIPVPGWTGLGAVSWLPDDDGLLMLSAKRSGGTLLHVSPTGAVATLRTETGRWLLNPRPAPDGRSVAIAISTADAKVWMVERESPR